MANSIEVRVPEEIMDYKESIIAGLSVRQLICGSIALLCGIPTFFLLKNINDDLALYSTMIVTIPAFCVGFIKRDGYNFETFMKIRLCNFFSKSKRGYEINSDSDLPIEIEEYRKLLLNKDLVLNNDEKANIVKNKKNIKAKKKLVVEYELVEIATRKKHIKKKRKEIYKSLNLMSKSYKRK